MEAFVDLLQVKSWKVKVISLYDFCEIVGLKEMESLGTGCTLQASFPNTKICQALLYLICCFGVCC